MQFVNYSAIKPLKDEITQLVYHAIDEKMRNLDNFGWFILLKVLDTYMRGQADHDPEREFIETTIIKLFKIFEKQGWIFYPFSLSSS